MWKETVKNEDYLGIEIFRFFFKCIICYSEMSMKTDPKNHGYKIDYGAIRGYEAFKDEKKEKEILNEKNEEKLD